MLQGWLQLQAAKQGFNSEPTQMCETSSPPGEAVEGGAGSFRIVDPGCDR